MANKARIYKAYLEPGGMTIIFNTKYPVTAGIKIDFLL